MRSSVFIGDWLSYLELEFLNKKAGILRGISGTVKVIQTNCSKMIPKHDQTAFFPFRQDKPHADIFEVKKACRKEQKMQKMIPKRDHNCCPVCGHRQDSGKEECLCRE